jgi:hypothetical protein
MLLPPNTILYDHFDLIIVLVRKYKTAMLDITQYHGSWWIWCKTVLGIQRGEKKEQVVPSTDQKFFTVKA